MTEEWRPVVGYEGHYEVSSEGRIRSLARTLVTSAGVTRRVFPRILKLRLNNHGYYITDLSRDTRNEVVRVHRVVATAFHGPSPSEKHYCCHGDGNPRNNRAENLRWATPAENVRDAIKHGTHYLACRNHCAKGHPYTPENTYMYRGRRHCRICGRERRRQYEARLEARRYFGDTLAERHGA